MGRQQPPPPPLLLLLLLLLGPAVQARRGAAGPGDSCEVGALEGLGLHPQVKRVLADVQSASRCAVTCDTRAGYAGQSTCPHLRGGPHTHACIAQVHAAVHEPAQMPPSHLIGVRSPPLLAWQEGGVRPGDARCAGLHGRRRRPRPVWEAGVVG
jgi:hypothetical protein